MKKRLKFLYRKFFKSLLKFGTHHDKCVQELLNANNKKYLRWCYFNCDMISFTDDILKEINIFERKIEKPGKYPLMGEAIHELISKYYTKGVSKFGRESKRRKRNRIAARKQEAKSILSKGHNRSINQKITSINPSKL